MPLWQIYHPEKAFSDEDKQAIAQHVTDMYESFMLPRFYVNVFFHALPKTSFYIGGEPCDDFVRVTIDHIARAIKDAETQQKFLKGCTRLLNPYVAGRGLRWELNVDDTPFEQWIVNGFKPPLPNTPAEIRWRSENRPSAYET
ncbi:MAG: tautomerase family protein [Nostoc sp.]|uniref:tautomerase family protein n=1 Tax=Nostoc sp. TaxID=1180 RepID=UPI002FFCB891